MRVVASNTFNVDWPALSSSDPIRWRPRADPVQKHDPGEMDPRKWKRGIDKPRPVTEARIERKRNAGKKIPGCRSLHPGYGGCRRHKYARPGGPHSGPPPGEKTKNP